ncbi:MAG: GtrA family protein [Erythrobacteraceae bacterium]|nr:GtrA family protein [Erythrobacteraceae bacterium]
MTRTALTLRYIAFAVIATLANLAVQRLVLAVPEPQAALAYPLALGAGTLAGLVIKYLLDKRWIFHDFSQGVEAHGKRFSLYALMGVATTAIFWGTETVFWLTCQTHAARELGAVLGLGIGYVVKYRLDRRFVFTTGGSAAA